MNMSSNSAEPTEMSSFDLAREAMSSGQRSTAIELFRKSLFEFPHAKTAELLGQCLLEQGEELEAIVFLGAAAGLGRGRYRCRYLMAKAWLTRGDYVNAALKASEAVVLKPDYKAARELLEEILKVRPDLADVISEEGDNIDGSPKKGTAVVAASGPERQHDG